MHPRLAAQLLGQPPSAGEVVYHIDGNSLNNAPEHLLVLRSQRHHASLEQDLRRARRGQLTLSSDLVVKGARVLARSASGCGWRS